MILFEAKKAILGSGLKQTHIARVMGLSPNTLSKKLHGYLRMTKAEKQLLAEVLGRDAQELFPEGEEHSH